MSPEGKTTKIRMPKDLGWRCSLSPAIAHHWFAASGKKSVLSSCGILSILSTLSDLSLTDRCPSCEIADALRKHPSVERS